MCADGSRARSEMNKTAQASKKFGSDVMKGFKQLIGAATIAGAAYLAIRKMTEFIKGSFKAYGEYENQLSMLNATLQSTGYAAGLSSDELIKMANELQRFTTVSNTAALEAEGIMLTFTKIGKEVFPEALEAATNMSVRFGQDLKQSMVQLGTALNDPIMGVGRLKRIGISFTEQQKDQIKVLMEANDVLGAQKVILDELEMELGGVARAMRDTFKGELTAYKNNMEDLKRIIGGLMSEDTGLKGFVSKMNEFLETEKNMRNIVRVFQSFGLVMAVGMRLNIFLIHEFNLGMKAMWDALMDVGKLIKVVFDPRNWKPGKMKEALADFHWTVVDTFKDITAEAVKFAEETRKSFEKILSPELPGTNAWRDTMLAMEGASRSAAGAVKDVGEDIKIVGTWVEDFADDWEMLGTQMKITPLDLGADEMSAASEAIMEGLRKQGEAYNLAATAAEAYRKEQQKMAEETRKVAEAQKELGDQLSYISTSSFGLFNQMLSNNSTATDNWYQHQKDVIESTVTDEEEKKAQLEALDEEYAAKKTEIAKQEKAFNIFHSIIDTAMGVSKALAQGGAILGIPWAAVVGALGAAQTAAIIAAPIPTYQQGGTTPGAYGGGDSQLALTEPGEMILTKELVRRNRALLTRMDSGTTDMTVVVQLGTKLIYKEITKAINETNEIKIRAR